jgi:hypothetical protein
MQPLTDAQRALLVARHIEVTAGLELLAADLTVVRDISDVLVGGRVAHNVNARIHGTCTLQLAEELAWGAVLVRPYMKLTDRDVSERFNLGVFALLTPERPVAAIPSTFEVAGYDRLYLLDREVGDSYEVDADVSVVTAIAQVITDSGLTGVLIDETSAGVLPKPMVWPLVPSADAGPPTTWLRIVNDLAASINYRGLWVDQNGLYRTGPYQEPAVRSPEFEFTADDPELTIIGEDRTVIEDQWGRVNRWIFVQQNRSEEAAEDDGVYIIDQSEDTELLGGLIWPKQVTVDVADQASLISYGERVAAAALRQVTTLKVTTGPFPPGHADIYSYVDVATIGTGKVQAINWELDFVQGDCRFEWELVPA